MFICATEAIENGMLIPLARFLAGSSLWTWCIPLVYLKVIIHRS